MPDSSWTGVIGALGGVALTGVVGLGSAALSRRWTSSDRERDRADARDALRRQAYVDYMAATNSLAGALRAALGQPAIRDNWQGFTPGERYAAIREAKQDIFDEWNRALSSAMIACGDQVRPILEGHDRQVSEWITMVLGCDDTMSAFDLLFEMPPSVDVVNTMRRELVESDLGTGGTASDAGP